MLHRLKYIISMLCARWVVLHISGLAIVINLNTGTVLVNTAELGSVIKTFHQNRFLTNTCNVCTGSHFLVQILGKKS